ncbi:MAG: hypothetical protein AB7K68_11055 [Bacteriovoracia bacterium]
MKSLPKFIPFAVGAFLISSGAQAAAPFCLPFAALKINATNCDDNFALGKQADNCLSLFTTALSNNRAQIDKILKAEAAKGSSGQNITYKTTGSIFAQTLQELDHLIASGEQAKFAVKTYSDNLSLPEDYDQPALTGMSTEKYLSVEPCYATPFRMVSEDSAVLSLMVEDLKKAKSEVLAKSGLNQVNLGQVESSSDTKVLKGKPVAPTGLPKESAVKNRDSDVTGILEDQKKREEKK